MYTLPLMMRMPMLAGPTPMVGPLAGPPRPMIETCSEPEPKDAVHSDRATDPDITITRLLDVTAAMASCGLQYGDAEVPEPPEQPLEFCTKMVSVSVAHLPLYGAWNRQIPGPVVHWLSLVQASHMFTLLQMGVVPLQSALVTQPTHWPAKPGAVELSLGTQIGLLLVQAGAMEAPASLRLPPSTPASALLPVGRAPGSSQPTHLFCAQKAFLLVLHSLFWVHSTQLPVLVLQTDVAPVHMLTPPVGSAHETQRPFRQ